MERFGFGRQKPSVDLIINIGNNEPICSVGVLSGMLHNTPAKGLTRGGTDSYINMQMLPSGIFLVPHPQRPINSRGVLDDE